MTKTREKSCFMMRCEVQYDDDEVLCWCQFEEFQKSSEFPDTDGRRIESRCLLITDLVDQHCRHSCLGSKPKVLVWLYDHCLNTLKEVNLTGYQVPPMTLPSVFESMQRSQVDKVLTKMAHWRRQRLKDVG